MLHSHKVLCYQRTGYVMVWKCSTRISQAVIKLLGYWLGTTVSDDCSQGQPAAELHSSQAPVAGQIQSRGLLVSHSKPAASGRSGR